MGDSRAKDCWSMEKENKKIILWYGNKSWFKRRWQAWQMVIIWIL